MNNIAIINSVFVLFFIMIIGFISKKLNIINNNFNKNLSNYILDISVPCLIITSFQLEFSTKMLTSAIEMFLYSSLIHIILIALSYFFYFKVKDNSKRILKFMTIFTNCGFMGYPIIESIYGKNGIFFVSIYVVVFNVFLWTIGISLFKTNKKMSFKTLLKNLINPGIIAVLVGLFIFIFPIKLPLSISKTIEIVGSTTTPLSMILVGSLLSNSKLKSIFMNKVLYFGAIIKLLIAPLFIYILLSLITTNTLLLNICVIITAMPAAANTAIFAEKFEGDTSLASTTTFLTTLLSILTIPLWIIYLISL